MTEGAPVHRYATTCTWSGSTGAGYDAYDRTHECSNADVFCFKQ